VIEFDTATEVLFVSRRQLGFGHCLDAEDASGWLNDRTEVVALQYHNRAGAAAPHRDLPHWIVKP